MSPSTCVWPSDHVGPYGRLESSGRVGLSGHVGTDMCPVGGLSMARFLGSGIVDCFQGVIAWLGDNMLVCYCIKC